MASGKAKWEKILIGSSRSRLAGGAQRPGRAEGQTAVALAHRSSVPSKGEPVALIPSGTTKRVFGIQFWLTGIAGALLGLGILGSFFILWAGAASSLWVLRGITALGYDERAAVVGTYWWFALAGSLSSTVACLAIRSYEIHSKRRRGRLSRLTCLWLGLGFGICWISAGQAVSPFVSQLRNLPFSAVLAIAVLVFCLSRVAGDAWKLAMESVAPDGISVFGYLDRKIGRVLVRVIHVVRRMAVGPG